MRHLYYIDHKRVVKNKFYMRIGDEINTIAKEDGIYYEWLNNNLPTLEFEEWFDGKYDYFSQQLTKNNQCIIGNSLFEIKEINRC